MSVYFTGLTGWSVETEWAPSCFLHIHKSAKNEKSWATLPMSITLQDLPAEVLKQWEWAPNSFLPIHKSAKNEEFHSLIYHPSNECLLSRTYRLKCWNSESEPRAPSFQYTGRLRMRNWTQYSSMWEATVLCPGRKIPTPRDEWAAGAVLH